MKTKLLLLLSLIGAYGYSQQPFISMGSIEELPVFEVLSSETPFDQSNSGPNQIWDISGMTSIGQVSDDPGDLTASEINEFPNTTGKVRTYGGVDDVTTESIIFSTENAGVTSITGVISDGLKLNYSTDNASVGSFPLNYGYSTTDAIAGTFNYGTYSGTFSGTLTVSVDAHGTFFSDNSLMYDPAIAVTRLKSQQNISLFYPPFGNVGTITITSYSYQNDSDEMIQNIIFRSATTTMVVPLLSINETKTRMELFVAAMLGTPEISKEDNSLKLYPNPVNDFLTIQTNETIESITVSDVNGRLVLQSNAPLNTINVSALQNGLYFASITTNTGTVTKKIIKK